MKNFFMFGLALAILFSACTKGAIESNKGEQSQIVNLQIITGGWNGTRANDGLLAPVTLLLVPDGESDVVSRKVVEDDDFSIEIPNGTFDIYAVCGLPADAVPDNVLESISIPLSESGVGLTDFALGSATITNEHGKLSATSVSIMAKRQMAWMTVTINDIPAYFTEIALFVKAAGETYSLSDGWSTSEEGKDSFTNCNIVRRTGKNFASMDRVCIPCTDKSAGTEFKIEAQTSDGKTLTYKYISNTPFVAGKHLTLALSISEDSLVTQTISQEAWDEKTENASLSHPKVE